jgi:predicted nucleic acid-binding Zn ribbon protein
MQITQFVCEECSNVIKGEPIYSYRIYPPGEDGDNDLVIHISNDPQTYSCHACGKEHLIKLIGKYLMEI